MATLTGSRNSLHGPAWEAGETMLPAELSGDVSAAPLVALLLLSSGACCDSCPDEPPAECMRPTGAELHLSAGTALLLARAGGASVRPSGGGRGIGPDMTPALCSVCKLRST